MPDQQKVMLVNVIAASGAKYVGGVYEWWTKGKEGTLTNVQNQKMFQCQEVK